MEEVQIQCFFYTELSSLIFTVIEMGMKFVYIIGLF